MSRESRRARPTADRDSPMPWAASLQFASTAAGVVTAAATMNWRLASWWPGFRGPRHGAGGALGAAGRVEIRFGLGALAGWSAGREPEIRRCRGRRRRRPGCGWWCRAAAADQGHPGLGEPADVAGEVAAVDGELELRGPVRRGCPAFGCALTGTDARVLGHGQHALRADGAVGAQHRHRQAGQHGGHLRGASPRPGCTRRRRRWPGR